MTALEWVRDGKALLLPLMDGEITKRDLKFVDKWMRRGRRLLRRELQGIVDDDKNVAIVQQVYAVLSAAEFYLMLRD